MTRTLNIFLILFLISNSTLAQNNDSLTQDIRLKYNNIRTNLATLDSIKIDIWGESAEGGIATAFYNRSNLKLIQVVWFGETGKKMIEYYFDNDKLIFAFEQAFKYNRPIYWTKKDSIEMLDDDEVFDPQKTEITENRYYFNNENLYRWLDNEKKEKDVTTATNSEVGNRLVTHCRKIIDELKK